MNRPPDPPSRPLADDTAAGATTGNDAGAHHEATSPFRRRGWAHVAAIVVLTLSVLYLASLTRMVLLAHRGEQLERGLATEVGALDGQVGRLATAAVYARSDAYVEQWARDERGMARPGDHVMVPVEATLVVSGTQTAATPMPSSWDRLRQWFGGGR